MSEDLPRAWPAVRAPRTLARRLVSPGADGWLSPRLSLSHR